MAARKKKRPTAKRKPAKAKKPSGRLTDLEREERIAFAADMLVRHRHKSEQIKAITHKFTIQWRQAETYLAEARKRALDLAALPANEVLAEHIDFLRSIMYDATAGAKNQLQAQKQLSRLLGLRSEPTEDSSLKGRVEFITARVRMIEAEVANWEPPRLAVTGPPPSPQTEVNDAAVPVPIAN